MKRKRGSLEARRSISERMFQEGFDTTFFRIFNEAFEQVSMQIFHHLIKTQTDGLPNDLGSLEIWKTALISRGPTETEVAASSRLALAIENEAYNVIYKSVLFNFLNHPQVSSSLQKRIVASRARAMAHKKKLERTLLFEAALKTATRKSTKEVLRDMEASGKIEDMGDHYLIVHPNRDRARWLKIKKTTIDSKLSRLRATMKKHQPRLA